MPSEFCPRAVHASDSEPAAPGRAHPKKSLGQHFLRDEGACRRIVDLARVEAGDQVLEIGPGRGALTRFLRPLPWSRLILVEKDDALAAEHAARPLPGLQVVHGDALAFDWTSLAGGWKIVGNLPYNVATPILLTLLERFDNLHSFLVMVQKEVADRLSEKPGSKIYGTPSVKLAWYGTAKSVGNIGRNVFWPAPNVDSALVRFERHAADDPRNPNNRSVGRDLVFRLIDASFAQRRKTLHAALRKIVPSGAFERAGIDPTRRGETLDIDEFVALATACKELEA